MIDRDTPGAVPIALCECGLEQRMTLGSLYSCRACGLITCKRTYYEMPCPDCNWPVHVDTCTTCFGKGFVQPPPRVREEERARIISWLRNDRNELRDNLGSHALYRIADALERSPHLER